MALTVLLQVGILLGGPLPLMAPLLSIGVCTEQLLAAVSAEHGKFQAVSRGGDALRAHACLPFDTLQGPKMTLQS